MKNDREEFAAFFVGPGTRSVIREIECENGGEVLMKNCGETDLIFSLYAHENESDPELTIPLPPGMKHKLSCNPPAKKTFSVFNPDKFSDGFFTVKKLN